MATEPKIKPHLARPLAPGQKAVRRTKVANGKALLSPEAGHGNGWWARRYAEILELRLDDLGGGATLSEGQISLSKRATTLEIELERMDADLSAGKDVPLKVYAEVTGQLVRVLNALGLKRVARDTAPTIDAILARHAQ